MKCSPCPRFDSTLFLFRQRSRPSFPCALATLPRVPVGCRISLAFNVDAPFSDLAGILMYVFFASASFSARRYLLVDPLITRLSSKSPNCVLTRPFPVVTPLVVCPFCRFCPHLLGIFFSLAPKGNHSLVRSFEAF